MYFDEAAQTRIGAFAWWDVIVSAIVLIGFILYEGKRKSIKYLWVPIVGTFTIGVSFGLPAFHKAKEVFRQPLTQPNL